MMNERFSVEDILNEVKAMTGENYVASPKAAEETFEAENDVSNFQAPKSSEEESQLNLFETEAEDFAAFEKSEETKIDDQVFYEQVKSRKTEYADLSADDFLSQINQRILGESTPKKTEIVDGFTVVNEEKEPEVKSVEEVFESRTIDEIKEVVQEPKQEVQDAPEETIVFDKQTLLDAVSKKPIVDETDETDKVFEEDFSEIRIHKDHKPEHLLSVDEINNDDMKSNLGFRLGNKFKDLTKDEDEFSIFKKPEEKEENENVKINVVDEIPEEQPETEEFFESLNEKYEDEEKTKNIIESQPDVLNNDVEIEEVVEEIPADEVFVNHKIEEAVSLETEVASTSNNRFSRKSIRPVEEIGFDYSETVIDEEDEVIDDYSSIEDEEAVRFDLDLSLKRVSNRLLLTIIAFILSFVVSVLPSLDINLIPAISPIENLNGFLIANASVLLFAIIINITAFFSGLGGALTFRPSADSALSVATVFVALQSGLAFVPQLNSNADAIPFYTAGLIFAYILSLIGKKSMVMRIKSNFRLVATTSVKYSCSLADEKLSEMLENDDFIGAPYTAVSKGTINLQNYLKNSYCEDPSDNVSKIFALISFIASILTFGFVYFSTKDVMSACAYSAAVALLSTPICAIMIVNSPIKKAAIGFRQQDGLLTSYASVQEFCDTECVVVEAEKLFPAGSIEMKNLSAIGDASIEEIILKSAALTIAAGGPLADVFDKMIASRRKMLPPVTDIVYEDGFGLTGNVEGKIVRVGNRRFMDAYGVCGLADDDLELRASKEDLFIVYTAIEDEVCGIFALKYRSIDPDIEDAVYNLAVNGVTLAVKTNDPNITPELIEKVFEIPSDYVLVMEAQTTECYEEITRPSKKADSLLAFGGRFATLANLIIACKKLETKVSVTMIIQIVLCCLGLGFGVFCAILGKTFDLISIQNVIIYQFAGAIITMLFSAIIKRIK